MLALRPANLGEGAVANAPVLVAVLLGGMALLLQPGVVGKEVADVLCLVAD